MGCGALRQYSFRYRDRPTTRHRRTCGYPLNADWIAAYCQSAASEFSSTPIGVSNYEFSACLGKGLAIYGCVFFRESIRIGDIDLCDDIGKAVSPENEVPPLPQIPIQSQRQGQCNDISNLHDVPS